MKVAHGWLNTTTCLITQHWVLKLSEFGMNGVVNELTQNDMVLWEESELEVLLHIAPELFQTKSRNDVHHKKLWPATMPGDIYACGCIMYQLQLRKPLNDSKSSANSEGLISFLLGF